MRFPWSVVPLGLGICTGSHHRCYLFKSYVFSGEKKNIVFLFFVLALVLHLVLRGAGER